MHVQKKLQQSWETRLTKYNISLFMIAKTEILHRYYQLKLGNITVFSTIFPRKY